MTSMEYFFAGIGIIITGGIITEFLKPDWKGFFFALSSIAGCILTGYTAFTGIAGLSLPEKIIRMNFPFGIARFSIDPLSGLFVMIFSIIFSLAAVYSAGYLSHYANSDSLRMHHLSLSLLAVSMMLVVTSANALVFLVIWEIMSLSSFILVSFENDREEVFGAAINYMISMHIGAAFLIASFAYLSYKAGGSDFVAFSVLLKSSPKLSVLIFGIVFAGFGMKAGFFPLHSWLPRAHPAAPAHVSAIMSGLMIKTGIYGILRFIVLCGELPKACGYALFIIAGFTAFSGILYAMNDRDIKRQLAYSSIENIGIIGISISIGILGTAYGNSYMSILGYTAAILHIINHSLFKTSLFLCSGTVYLCTHSRNMETMGGLIRRLPSTAGFYIIAAAAICGLPPLNGFISEFFIYYSMVCGLKTSPGLFIMMTSGMALLALIGGIAVLAFTKSAGVIFLGETRSVLHTDFTEKRVMIWPPLIITSLMFLAGLFPHILIRFAQGILGTLSGSISSADTARLTATASALSKGIILFYAILGILLLIRFILKRKGITDRFKTWDCGYQAGTPRMQYTASSFSDDSASLSKPVLISITGVEKPGGIFPGTSRLRSHAVDIIDIITAKYLKRPMEKFFDAISLIQSRSTQQYVIYVILFLIATFIWIIGAN